MILKLFFTFIFKTSFLFCYFIGNILILILPSIVFYIKEDRLRPSSLEFHLYQYSIAG